MKIPVKFISPLSDDQINDLNQVIKKSKKLPTYIRAKAILLSGKGYCIDDIANIFNVHRNTISIWIDKWERAGIGELEDKPRSGHPNILTDAEKELLIKLARENPRSIQKIMALLFEETGKYVSDTTIKRILKAAKFRWKRIRKSIKSKRNDEEFKAASESIYKLREQHDSGELEIWYFDETGFDLQPTVPYAWQPNGEIIEVSSERSKRLNVLGFLTPDNNFKPFFVEGRVNSDVVIDCFNTFVDMDSDTNRIVILDNASIHTSKIFLNSIGEWEKKGFFVKFLPTYSPELNIIEMLWRFIKYYWLPFSAYLSFENLVKEVKNTMAKIGTEFKINFAS